MITHHVVTAIGVAVFIVTAFALGQHQFAQVLAIDKKQDIPALHPPTNGAFSLIDHKGREVADRDFRGTFMLIYFGYTYCPDVCPTGLQMMSDAMDILGAAGEKVQPILISVDPERDTPDILADYVGAFHPRLVGLTGSRQEVKAVAKAYGARYFKLYSPPSEDDEGDEKTDGDENLDYAVHHTAHTYLVGPDGRGLATFPHGTWPQDMAARIQEFVEKQK